MPSLNLRLRSHSLFLKPLLPIYTPSSPSLQKHERKSTVLTAVNPFPLLGTHERVTRALPGSAGAAVWGRPLGSEPGGESPQPFLLTFQSSSAAQRWPAALRDRPRLHYYSLVSSLSAGTGTLLVQQGKSLRKWPERGVTGGTSWWHSSDKNGEPVDEFVLSPLISPLSVLVWVHFQRWRKDVEVSL